MLFVVVATPGTTFLWNFNTIAVKSARPFYHDGHNMCPAQFLFVMYLLFEQSENSYSRSLPRVCVCECVLRV